MDKKIKNKIEAAVRKINRNTWQPRKVVKNRAKVNKSLFRCEHCHCLIYEGESAVNYFNYFEMYAPIVVKMEKVEMDHISPVVDPETGWVDWNTWMERLFCPEENWQALCKECHKTKTNSETKVRWVQKYGDKKPKE